MSNAPPLEMNWLLSCSVSVLTKRFSLGLSVFIESQFLTARSHHEIHVRFLQAAREKLPRTITESPRIPKAAHT